MVQASAANSIWIHPQDINLPIGAIRWRCTATWCVFVWSILACSSVFVIAEAKEQHASMKFCFLLEKAAYGTNVMLQMAYTDTAISKTLFWVVLMLEQESLVTWRPTSFRVIVNHSTWMKTSQKLLNSSWKTAAEQMMNSLIYLAYPEAPTNAFWVRNCKRNELQQNMCPACSWKIKSSREECSFDQ